MKRIISLALSIALLLSITPLALAAEEVDYGENLCLGRDIYTDAGYNNNDANFAAELAIDGNVNTRAITANVDVSEDKRNGFQNYLLVDLGDVFELTRVVARSRRDTEAEWARRDYGIWLANKEDFSDAFQVGAKTEGGDFGSDLDVPLKNVRARYIIVANCTNVPSRGFGCSEIEAYGNEIIEGQIPEYSDVSGAVTNATKMLGALGIMSGITTKEFGATQLITRAEAAQIICNFAGIGPAGYKGQFADVAADNQYAGYIQSGLDAGFVSKAENFRPDDYVMGYELIKMVLCVNGYYIKTTNGVIYPKNILDVAYELDLLDGADTDGYDYINRANAAVVMYNALLANTFEYNGTVYEEGDEALLEKRFDSKLMNGILTDNGISRLDEEHDNPSTKVVTISGQTYSNDCADAAKLLGQTVYYLLNNEDIITVMWADNKENNLVKIDAEDIKDADFNLIQVYEGSKVKKYKMVEKPYVLLNDSAYYNVTAADLKPENGYLILVDNDDDGTYDVIKIYKPIVAPLSSVSYDAEAESFAFAISTGEKYSYNYDMANVVSDKGEKAKLLNIMGGQLAYVYASPNGKVLNIQRMPLDFVGTVESIDKELVTISGTAYEQTEYFKRLFPYLEVGTTAAFFKDLEGRLVYMSDAEDLKNSEFLAIVQKMAVMPDEELNTIKLFGSNGKFADLSFANKVTVNGASGKDVYYIESLGRSSFVGKLVKVSVNNNNLIYAIETEDYENGDIFKSEMGLKNAYRAGAGFCSGHELILPFGDGVPVFTVPTDEYDEPRAEAEYEKFYAVSDLAAKYTVGTAIVSDVPTVYGIDPDTAEPTALVQRLKHSESTADFGTISVKGSINSMIFDSYSVSVNADGEKFYVITGYDLTKGNEKIIELKPGITKAVNAYRIQNHADYSAGITETDKKPDGTKEFVDGEKMLVKDVVGKFDDVFFTDITALKRGDILRYDKGSYDTYSELELVAENVDFTDAGAGIKYSQGYRNAMLLSAFRLQYGIVESVVDGRLKFVRSQGIYETLNLSNFQGSLIVVNGGEIETYKVATAGVHLAKGDKIVIYSAGGYHKTIVVYR